MDVVEVYVMLLILLYWDGICLGFVKNIFK